MVRVVPIVAFATWAAVSVTAYPSLSIRDSNSTEEEDLSHIPEHLRKYRDEIDYEDEFCYDWDLGSQKGAQEAWKGTQANKFLDLWVDSLPRRDEDWLRHYERLIRGQIDSSITDSCTTIGGSCSLRGISGNCSESFDRSEWPWEQNAFWIFRAVEGLHDQLTEMYNRLHEATMLEGLKIDNMIEDLGDAEVDDNTLEWVAAGLSAANGFIGTIPVIGGPVSAFSNLANVIVGRVDAGNKKSPADYGGDVKEALAEACEEAADMLRAMLRGATGKGKDKDEYDSLAEFRDSDLKTNTGKFFEHSSWLTESSSSDVRDAMDEVAVHVRRRAFHEIIAAQGHRLRISWPREGSDFDGEECAGIQGRQWFEYYDGFKACYVLEKENGKLADEDLFLKHMPNYGLGNREWYYRKLMDCATNKSRKKWEDDPFSFEPAEWEKYALQLDEDRPACLFGDNMFMGWGSE